MSAKDDINALVKPVKSGKNLPDAKTKAAIPGKTGASSNIISTEKSSSASIAFPLTEISRQVEVVRIFNDINPDDWIDIKRVNGSIKFTDINGQEYEFILKPNDF